MIAVKSLREIELMRIAGRIAGETLKRLGAMIVPGITTADINREARRLVEASGAKPSFKGYNGFPASLCVAVNQQVIHGIPGKTKLREGDIIGLDIGACYQGYHGDCAATFAVGRISEEAARLIQVTRESFFKGLAFAKEGRRMGDIGRAVEAHVAGFGYTAIRDYTGHGIGTQLHEDPEVPNFARAQRGPRLIRGMTFCIEPMVAAGRHEVKTLSDGFTIATTDGSLAAHYEHTVLVTGGEPELLTAVEGHP
jgi:methionyl aminopeptidase